ncbi:MAG: major facilitator transporter [Rhodocyclaceae bacterium]|nr:MAG: major facilitator transporter [Rhodocyclaceae bacterium]TND00150.1 MAG: major facilitator transporter [Rhodocyclaceae bacterium]
MSRDEKRAGAALASIFGLRMLGLFLILPVFAIHAQSIPGGDDMTLVGIALGAYGLTQAMFQIPFGMASDAFGRKRVIIFGLLLFAAGSALAALATDIWWTIGGRVLQGAGAISAAVTALAADLTREQHRTKVMALIGSSIGLVFALSLVAAPALYAAIGMSGIFWMTAILAVAAIGLVTHVVPPAPPLPAGPKPPFRDVLLDTQLLRLNFGIFTLHMVQMAMFVVVPGLLLSYGDLPLASHWKVYLPAVLASFVLMVPAIVFAEKRNKVRPVFVFAIGLLLVTMLVMWLGSANFVVIAGGLLSFFVAFNILEAMLPSLISRIAPPRAKGAALGVYNTTQALGLFVGGALGGWLVKNFDAGAVFVFDAAMVALWLLAAATMTALPLRRPIATAPSAHGILETKT